MSELHVRTKRDEWDDSWTVVTSLGGRQWWSVGVRFASEEAAERVAAAIRNEAPTVVYA